MEFRQNAMENASDNAGVWRLENMHIGQRVTKHPSNHVLVQPSISPVLSVGNIMYPTHFYKDSIASDDNPKIAVHVVGTMGYRQKNNDSNYGR